MTTQPKQIITNQQFKAAIEMMTYWLTVTGNHKPDVIVTFPRGGLIPATYLSHALDIPIEIVYNSKYDYKREIVIPESLKQHKKILIVDDIIDTGDTIRDFIRVSGFHLDSVTSTAIIADQRILDIGLYYAPYTKTDAWVVFPWERNGD